MLQLSLLSLGFLALNLGWSARAEPPREPTSERSVVGLDHVPIAVHDLKGAADHYRSLGFRLKPGHPHANGILNWHVKFGDGSEIELLTVSEARDSLTRRYLQHLAQGEGPAYVGLFAPERDRVLTRLEALDYPVQRAGRLLTFPAGSGLSFLFFGPRNRSPSDRPEHFAHANGALSLTEVWLAGESPRIRELLAHLDLETTEQAFPHFGLKKVPTTQLPEGKIRFLPPNLQRVRDRPVVGLSLRVRDVETLREHLKTKLSLNVEIVERSPDRSLLLTPDQTHGLWIDFEGP